MSTRKYESGYEKLKKKRKIEKLIQSQKGALDKFITSDKPIENNSGDSSKNEQEKEQKNINDNENIKQKDDTRITTSNEEYEIEIKEDEKSIETYDHIPLKIYDPSQWTNIDTKLRDLLVEKGPLRDYTINFPKDEISRHFSTTHYTRTLSNGEKYDRKWLVYSKELDRVFCFCCKLFSSSPNTSKLASEGTRDWRNLGGKLKSHETTNEHITNMNAWVDLEIRLQKNKTIDKHLQEQISRGKEHVKPCFS